MFNKIFNKKGNKLYSRLFLSYILIVVIAIIITSVVMSMSFQQILVKKIYEAQKDNLRSAAYSVNNVYESIKTFILQLYFDSDISKLRILQNPEYDEINTATGRLNMFGTILPHIKSIYIYSDISDNYYVTIPYGPNRVYESSQFYDADTKKILDSRQQQRMLYPVNREFPMYNKDNILTHEKGFTFLFSGMSGEAVRLNEGAIIINVSEVWIKNVIGKYESSLNSNTYVMDINGEIIVKNDDQSNENLLQNEMYTQKILNSGNKYGQFYEKINGKQILVIYALYEPFQWVLVRTIPFDSILQEVSGMRIKILILGMIILIAGFFIALIISKKVYRPIDTILTRLSVFEGEMNNTMLVRKNEYLKKIIRGDFEEAIDNIPLNLKVLNINTDPGGKYVLVYLMLDCYSDFCSKYNNKDRELFKFAILNIAMELCAEHFVNEGVDLGEDHVVLLLNVKEPLQETYTNILETVIKSIQISTKNAITESISAVISPMGQDIYAVPSLYSKARKVSYDRFFSNHECILFYDASKKKEDSEYRYPVGKEKKLVDSLLSGNVYQSKMMYHEIVRTSTQYSYYTVRLVLLRLTSAICSALNMIEENQGILFEFNFEGFVSELDKMESLEEANGYYEVFFDSLTAKMDENKSFKHQDLIDSIIDLIEIHYSDINLSLDVIAEKVNMSSAYIGRLYKKLMAKSIVDHINEVRIHKAKEMLVSTEKPVYEISVAVGYTNIQHFYRVFKRFSGVTPVEYKNSKTNA